MVGAAPTSPASHPPERTLARTFFILRIAMFCLVVVVLSRHVHGALTELRSAQRAAGAEGAARAVQELVVFGGRERGLVAITATEAPNEERDLEVVRMRTEIDRLHLEALGAVRALARSTDDAVLETVLERVDQERERLLRARAAVDAAWASPSPELEAGQWIAAASRYHESLLGLYRELLDVSALEVPSMRETVHLRELTLDAVENAGQERAVLGVALAKPGGASQEVVADLNRRRGVVMQSLRRIDGLMAPRPPDERLTPAVQRMRAAFLEDFEAVRTDAYACVADPTRCTISSAQWYQRATLGIDAVAGVSNAAFERARDGIEATRKAATRALAFSVVSAAVALGLLFGAGSFIRRRILVRLEDLKDAALRVAGGELERPVTCSGRDEIAAAAGAVEHMRSSLHEQNQSLRSLLEQLKCAQGELVQRERLASVGHLAGGVAHEINNPLAIILGNIAHLIDTVGRTKDPSALDQDELMEVLQEMRLAAERSRAIVRDLRDFAALGPGGVNDIEHLDNTLRSLAPTLSATLPPRVRLQLDLGSPTSVAGSRMALEQVVKRLVDNSRDACAGAGVITVRSRSDHQHSILTVEDTGRGIAREDLGRVLEPFFTTKRIGAGTGLGLSVCLGIVKQLGGELAIDSEPGLGTRVTVTLPRVQAAA